MFNILDQLEEEPAKRPKGFDTGLGGLTAAQVAKATDDKSMAGQYKRWTITLPPGQIEVIKEAAGAEGMSTLAFVRWMLDLALQEYEAGTRPEIETQVIRGEAKLGHWSSQ